MWEWENGDDIMENGKCKHFINIDICIGFLIEDVNEGSSYKLEPLYYLID